MNQTVVLTGATSGMGLHATRLLLDRGYDVVAVGRDLSALPSSGRLHPIAADLSRMSNVDRLVEDVLGRGLPPLHGLIANAGAQFGAPTSTSDSLEATLALNVLSPLRLIDRISPALPPGSRVVLTTSGTHDPDLVRFLPRARHDAAIADLAVASANPKSPRVDGFRRYATSKLALVRCLPRLAGALQERNVAVLGFDPGLMPDTGLARGHGARASRVYGALSPALLLLPGAHLSRTSAGNLVDLATADRWRGVSGAHVTDRNTSGTSRASYDLDTGDRWYADLLRLAGATTLEQSSAATPPG